MSRLLNIFILACIVCAFVGCKREVTEDRATERAELLDGLNSFDSPTEAKAKLNPKLLPWRVIEEPKPQPPTDKRPPFNELIVRVAGYDCLGHAGDLELRFFNDRLMEVRFFPSDLTPFLTSLRGKKKIDLFSAKESVIRQHVRVWVRDGANSESYVGWGDVRLEAEMTDWIRRYS